jgi:hypothetical protein
VGYGAAGPSSYADRPAAFGYGDGGGPPAVGNGSFNGGGPMAYPAGPLPRAHDGLPPPQQPPANWEADAIAAAAARSDRVNATDDAQWSREDFPWSAELRAKNASQFGNRDFRPLQLEVCNATMAGRDVLVLMPTGGGKSLTYQLPAVVSSGLTVVVSPLISLIQDQCDGLRTMGVHAAALSSTVLDGQPTVQQVYQEVRSGALKVRVVSRLLISSFSSGTRWRCLVLLPLSPLFTLMNDP